MQLTQYWRTFIDKTARRPEGKWAIKAYNSPSAHYRSFRVILEILHLREDDLYCEIGCGGGVLLNMAMEKVKRGMAIDHSKDMVALAARNNRRFMEAGTLEIVQGSAESLPWPTDSVTACASANMFFFVEKPKDMLGEVYRILAPGGRFSMVTMNNGFPGKITFGWLYALKLYSDREMTAMLTGAGFSNVNVKTKLGMMQVCYGEKKTEREEIMKSTH